MRSVYTVTKDNIRIYTDSINQVLKGITRDEAYYLAVDLLDAHEKTMKFLEESADKENEEDMRRLIFEF